MEEGDGKLTYFADECRCRCCWNKIPFNRIQHTYVHRLRDSSLEIIPRRGHPRLEDLRQGDEVKNPMTNAAISIDEIEIYASKMNSPRPYSTVAVPLPFKHPFSSASASPDVLSQQDSSSSTHESPSSAPSLDTGYYSSTHKSRAELSASRPLRHT